MTSDARNSQLPDLHLAKRQSLKNNGIADVNQQNLLAYYPVN
jgi:hypothetical protein